MISGPLVQAVQAVTSAVQVPIVANAFASYVEIAEDGSGSAAGIKVTWPNGNVAEYTTSMQPVTIGSKDHIGRGPHVGCPANYNGGGGAATQYCTVESLGANTVVRTSEWC